MYRGEFLAQLINEHQLQRVAELGLWKARTLCHLLDNCPSITEYIGVDEWRWCPERKGIAGGQDYHEWMMPGLEPQARARAAKYGERVRIIKSDTAKAAVHVEGLIDLVFIDADHSFEGAKRDILAWRPKLRPGGFLVGHDYEWETVKQAVDEVVGTYETIADDGGGIWWTTV